MLGIEYIGCIVRNDEYLFEQILPTDEGFLGFYSQGKEEVEIPITETELVPVEV